MSTAPAQTEALLRVSCGPSPHLHCLANGSLRAQKKTPRKPAWRLVVLDQERHELAFRFWRSVPPLDELVTAVVAALGAFRPDTRALILPRATIDAFPGLVAALRANGAILRKSPTRDASAAAVVRTCDRYVMDDLNFHLSEMAEDSATPEEMVAAANGPAGFVVIPPMLPPDNVRVPPGPGRQMAEHICRSRGRDPAGGYQRGARKTRFNPLNRPDRAVPEGDTLDRLAGELKKQTWLTEFEYFIWRIVERLEQYRRAGDGNQDRLLSDLGELVGHWVFFTDSWEKCVDSKHYDWRFWTLTRELGEPTEASNLVVRAAIRWATLPLALPRGGYIQVFALGFDVQRDTTGHEARRLLGMPRDLAICQILQRAFRHASMVGMDPTPRPLPGKPRGDSTDGAMISRLVWTALQPGQRLGSRFRTPHTPSTALGDYAEPAPDLHFVACFAAGGTAEGLGVRWNALPALFAEINELLDDVLARWKAGVRIRARALLTVDDVGMLVPWMGQVGSEPVSPAENQAAP